MTSENTNNNLPASYTPTALAPISQTNETAAAVLGARAEAEIKARTFVALTRPRDMQAFRTGMLAACDRFRFADSAMYEKPVGGGKVSTGLSIRFAEEAQRLYGNLDTSVVVVSEDDDRRVIEAVCVDLQNNGVHRVQAVIPKYVERLQPKKGDEILGQRVNSRNVVTYKIRASDDALFTEHQKNAAKAVREVILKHIPSEIKEECEERINQTMQSIGEKDPAEFLKQVLGAFHALGISREQVEEFLGKSTVSMNVAEMHLLRRIVQGIKQGEGSWAEVMDAKRAERGDAAPQAATPAAGAKGAGAKLAEQLAPKKVEDAPAPAAAAPPPPPPVDTEDDIRAQDAETARLDAAAETKPPTRTA